MMVVDGQIYSPDLIRRRDIFNLIASVRVGSNGGRLSGKTRRWGSPSSWWRHGRPAAELTLTLRRPNLDENRSYVIAAGWEAHLRGSQAAGMTGAGCAAVRSSSTQDDRHGAYSDDQLAFILGPMAAVRCRRAPHRVSGPRGEI
jgi:hypothetical protein